MPGIRLSDEELGQILIKYICILCNLLLRNPVQAECGHHFCKSCAEQMFENPDNESKCQKDGTLISKQTVFPDAFVNREIMSMVVSCLHKSFGCTWRDEVRKYEPHLAECDFVPVQCVYAGCGKLMSRMSLPDHLEKECTHRPVMCSYCNGDVTYSKIKEHEETECPKFIISCPLCKDKKLPREEITRHQDALVGECEVVEAPCNFSVVGCQEQKIMKRKDRKQHEASMAPVHLTYVLGFCLQIRDKLQNMFSEMLSLREGVGFVENFKQQVLGLASVVQTTAADTQETKSIVCSHEHRITELEKSSSNHKAASASGRPSGGDQESLRRLNNQEAKTADHEVLIVELNQKMVDLSGIVGTLRRKLEASQDQCTRLQRKVESHEHVLAMRNVALADLEEFVRQQQVSSYDGVLMWKITDYARRKNEAMTGKQASFYSPCFYTGRHGYKMCARIYLHGDGMGKGTHISVFFVVMRGQFDALLRWPFKQKVTIMLLDQDNVNHVIDAFRPDSGSASFQRPRREMNVASGCPLFCSLTELNKHAYVRDDTMFVKIIVDNFDL